MRKSTGPKTEPCGTSESTGAEEEDFPSRTTFCDLHERKEPSQPKVYSNKKITSDFHGTVSINPVKMSQQK